MLGPERMKEIRGDLNLGYSISVIREALLISWATGKDYREVLHIIKDIHEETNEVARNL